MCGLGFGSRHGGDVSRKLPSFFFSANHRMSKPCLSNQISLRTQLGQVCLFLLKLRMFLYLRLVSANFGRSILVRRARTICLIDKENIQVGKRSIHLVEKHWDILIKFSERSKRSESAFAKWLEKHRLHENSKTIADAMKKDRKVRLPFSYLSHFFAFPDHTSAR